MKLVCCCHVCACAAVVEDMSLQQVNCVVGALASENASLKNFIAAESAAAVEKATSRVGTDETRLIEVLANRTKVRSSCSPGCQQLDMRLSVSWRLAQEAMCTEARMLFFCVMFAPLLHTGSAARHLLRHSAAVRQVSAADRGRRCGGPVWAHGGVCPHGDG